MHFYQHGSECVIERGGVALLNDSERGGFRSGPHNAWTGITVSRRQLRAVVAHAEDLLARPLDPRQASVRYLRRYLDLALGPDGIGDDEGLNEHIGTTLIDLMALTLGASEEAAEIARRRGIRAARQREIVSAIAAGFADPNFSPQSVARKLNLSPRYVQDLLQELGFSFTDRVMELRLERARSMLADPRHHRLKVIEIALACGFNEVSYFNRCFRRRFGSSPTQLRSGAH